MKKKQNTTFNIAVTPVMSYNNIDINKENIYLYNKGKSGIYR